MGGISQSNHHSSVRDNTMSPLEWTGRSGRRLYVSEVKEAALVHTGGQDYKGSLSREGEWADSPSLASIPNPIQGAISCQGFASQIIWLRKRFVGPGSFWKSSRNAAIGAAQHPPGIQLWELGQGFQELHLLALTHICILPSGETWRGKTGKGRKSWLCYLSIVSSLTASCQSLVFSDIKHVNSIAL